MMTETEIITENRRRRAVIESPYDPVTGYGSTSIERMEVYIPDAPIKRMWLPKNFASSGFVKTLSRLGFNRYIREKVHTGADDFVREELWRAFCELRMKEDFEFYGATCITIVQKGTGKEMPFILNRPQRYVLHTMEELRMAGEPIDIILLKARQWGGSTLVDIYSFWIQTILRTHWNSVICAHVESAARTVSGILQRAVNHLPAWATSGVQVKTTPYQGSSKTRVINPYGSRYSVGSAERPENLRSEDISMVHLTEVGLWQATKGKKPEDLIQAIFGSVHRGSHTMKVLESTAKGVGNYFHRTWLDAVEGKNDLTPVFVPWFMIDIYSKPIGAKNIPAFIHTMSEEEHRLFELGATLEAINWYRDTALQIPDKWRLCSEFPSTAAEAFQTTGHRVFPIQYVEQVRRMTRKPCFYGDFIGNAKSGKESLEKIHFVRMDNTSDGDNICHVWALPDNSVRMTDRYVVSVDIGGVGEDSDPSVIKVADRYPMLEDGGVPEVVLEWHGHLEHDVLAWKAAQIATAYGNALLVVESNTYETEETEGDNFEYILDEIADNYTNLYSRTSAEQIRKGMPLKYGFHTNTKTKPLIIDFLRKAMRDALYIERSLPTTFEMDTYQFHDGSKMDASDGCHDDRVMATAILIYVCYKWPLYNPERHALNVNKRTEIVSEASM